LARSYPARRKKYGKIGPNPYHSAAACSKSRRSRHQGRVPSDCIQVLAGRRTSRQCAVTREKRMHDTRFKSIKVVAVDDNAHSRELLKLILRSSNAEGVVGSQPKRRSQRTKAKTTCEFSAHRREVNDEPWTGFQTEQTIQKVCSWLLSHSPAVCASAEWGTLPSFRPSELCYVVRLLSG
jgi:hypothetical protein